MAPFIQDSKTPILQYSLFEDGLPLLPGTHRVSPARHRGKDSLPALQNGHHLEGTGMRKFNARAQRSESANKGKPVLTQRRKDTRSNAEKKNSLRLSANLRVSALVLRSLRANRDRAVQRRRTPCAFAPLRLCVETRET